MQIIRVLFGFIIFFLASCGGGSKNNDSSIKSKEGNNSTEIIPQQKLKVSKYLTAIPQTLYTYENQPLNIILHTFAYSIPYAYKFKTEIVSYPKHGVYKNNIYIPNKSFVGIDTLKFLIKEKNSSSEIATININVLKNLDIIDTNRTIIVSKGHSKRIALGNSSHSYEIISSPKHGKLSGKTPKIIYTPKEDYIGSDSFTVLIDGVEYTINIELKEFKLLYKVSLGARDYKISFSKYDKYGNLINSRVYFQDEIPSHIDLHKLKKFVNNDKQYKYTFNQNQQVLTKKGFDQDGNLFYDEKNEYDNEGRIKVKTITTITKGVIGKDQTTKLYDYIDNKTVVYIKKNDILRRIETYDSDDKLIRKEDIDGHRIYNYTYNLYGDPLEYDSYTFTYDSKGNLLTKISSGEVWKYTYDEYNRVLTFSYTFGRIGGKPDDYYRYYYDNDNNLVKTDYNFQEPTSDDRNIKYAYKYDSLGNRVVEYEDWYDSTQKEYKSDGVYDYKTYYSYDKYGNLESIIFYDYNSNISSFCILYKRKAFEKELN